MCYFIFLEILFICVLQTSLANDEIREIQTDIINSTLFQSIPDSPTQDQNGEATMVETEGHVQNFGEVNFEAPFENIGEGGEKNYFMDIYSVQTGPKQVEFGHVYENPSTWEQRYEKKDHDTKRFQGQARWGDKSGGYGEHYWDLNHAGNDQEEEINENTDDTTSSEVEQDPSMNEASSIISETKTEKDTSKRVVSNPTSAITVKKRQNQQQNPNKKYKQQRYVKPSKRNNNDGDDNNNNSNEEIGQTNNSGSKEKAESFETESSDDYYILPKTSHSEEGSPRKKKNPESRDSMTQQSIRSYDHSVGPYRIDLLEHLKGMPRIFGQDGNRYSASFRH